MADNEIQEPEPEPGTFATAEPDATAEPEPEPGTVATPGRRRRLGNIPAGGTRPYTSLAGLTPGSREWKDAKNARSREERAAKSAGAKTRSAARPPAPGASKTGRPTATAKTGPRQSLVDVPEVDARPLDAPLSGVPQLDIYPAITAVLTFVAGAYAQSKPLVDAGSLPIPALQEHGPEVLRKLWTLTPEEIDSVAIPASNVIPALPPKVLKRVNAALPYAALIGAIANLAMPRMAFERQLIGAIRSFNAGTHTAQSGGTVQSAGGPDTGRAGNPPASQSGLWDGPNPNGLGTG